MGERIDIDNTSDEKSTDFYYSASDVYGVNVFTDEFHDAKDTVVSEETEKNDVIMTELFSGTPTVPETYENITSLMFMGKQYETRYRDYNSGNSSIAIVGWCLLSSLVSLGICIFITYKVKKTK